MAKKISEALIEFMNGNGVRFADRREDGSVRAHFTQAEWNTLMFAIGIATGLTMERERNEAAGGSTKGAKGR